MTDVQQPWGSPPTEEDQLPKPPKEGGDGFWSRNRMTIGVAIGAFLAGLIVAPGGDQDALDSALTAQQAAETQVADLEAALEEADARAVEAEEDAEADIAAAEEEAADAQAEAEGAKDAALVELEDELDAMRENAEAEAAGILEEAEARVAELDEREAEITQAEETQARNTFHGGVHVVGTDIEPGTYRSDGGGTCYWARLRNLDGGVNSIIANGIPDGPVTVNIAASDAAFESSGCGEWTRR